MWARRNSGLGMAELIIGMAIFAMLMLVFHQIHNGTQRATGKASAASEALNSSFVAVEFLRYDIGRILLRGSEDLKILDDGHRLEFTASGPSNPDLTLFNPQEMAYFLGPVVGKKGARRLFRKSADGARYLEGCYLKEFDCRLVPGNEDNGINGYLQISLVGLDGVDARSSFASSCLIPLRIAAEPLPYQLIADPVSN
jgi:hypothetical protein